MHSAKILYPCFALLFPLVLALYLKEWVALCSKASAQVPAVHFEEIMPRGIRYLFTTILASFAPWLDFSAAQNDFVVDLGYAQYQGMALENGITQWLGMRFAAPPLGDLRFRAPADPLPEEGVVQAFTVSSLLSAIDIP